jgi:hypothetical protein
MLETTRGLLSLETGEQRAITILLARRNMKNDAHGG